MSEADAEELKQLYIDKAKNETELDLYRKDFLTLITCEDELAKIYSIAENSDYTLECFSASMNSTEKFKNEQRFPGFEALFTFTENVVSIKDPLQEGNNDFMDNLKKMLIEIDEIKAKDTQEIEKINNELNRIISRIRILEYYNGG